MKDLEELYELWRAAVDGRDGAAQIAHIKAARLLSASRKPEFWLWLTEALRDEDRKWFAARFFKSYPVPRRLLKEMIRAGVYERDPSFNGLFIKPCVSSFGSEAISTVLLRYFEYGSNIEKAGAVSAFYWVRGSRPELIERFHHLMLIEFVDNPDLDVRRRIIPMLELSKRRYPKHLRPLVAQAIAIARSHSDQYIRHRVEIQLGGSGPLMPIPH